MKDTKRYLFVFLLLIGLTSCGYSLRGNELIDTNFEALKLNLAQPNSEFSRILRRNLAGMGVRIDDENDIAKTGQVTPTILTVSAEQITNRPVTINPRARAAQYEMRLSIIIELQEGDKTRIEPEALFVEQTYFEDIENIAGNKDEVQIITTEMRRNLVTQLIRRLESHSN